MRSLATVALGVVAGIVGLVWMLQGLGLLGGSLMSGADPWAVAGAVLLAIGLALVLTGLRAHRRTRRAAR